MLVFPSIKQYKKWSLPAKYALWGLVLAAIPIGVELRAWIVAVPEYAVIAYNSGESEMTIYGSEGDTPETAVIIRGVKSHASGVKAEYYWLRRRFPGYRMTSQALIKGPEPGPGNFPPRMYDMLIVRNWYGRTRTIYFDISRFVSERLETPSQGSGEPGRQPQAGKRP